MRTVGPSCIINREVCTCDNCTRKPPSSYFYFANTSSLLGSTRLLGLYTDGYNTVSSISNLNGENFWGFGRYRRNPYLTTASKTLHYSAKWMFFGTGQLPAELIAVGLAAVCVLRSGTMECEDAARTQSGSVLICVTGLPVSMAWHAQRRPVRSMGAVLACLRSLRRGSRDHASQDQLLYCAHGPSDRRADSPTFLFGPDKVANDQLALQRFEGLYPACRPQMSGLMKHCLCCYGAIAKRRTIYAPPESLCRCALDARDIF
ncbi:hypothetical protein B0H11DRAFT_534122 [Mycena galericulata]|nr:hypothetical protein B0H11DRAFT_534122 [Mycena galericulata]